MSRRAHCLIMLLGTLFSLTLLCPRAEAAASVKHLTITHSLSYPPFSYRDTDGKAKGYLIDLWQAFGQANNIEITFKQAVWQETLDMVQNGQADVHGGLFFSGERDRFLDFGPTIMDISTALYVRDGISMDSIRTQPIGVIQGGYSSDFMSKNSPDQLLAGYPSTSALIKAAAKGEVDAFVSDQPSAAYYLAKENMTERFISRQTLYSLPLRAAVGEGQHDILEVIHNGWSNIDQSAQKRIYDRWFVQAPSTPTWLIPAMVAILIVLISGTIFRKAVNRALRPPKA